MGRVVARGRIGSGGGAIELSGRTAHRAQLRFGSGGGGGLGTLAMSMKARCAGRDRGIDGLTDSSVVTHAVYLHCFQTGSMIRWTAATGALMR